jgi:hypothetical protein
MLSALTPTPTAITLDVATDNWSSWHQALKQLCYTKFGVAGQQILTNATIPLHPFAREPTRNDLDTDPTGAPIQGQLTYSRRSLTTAEAAIAPPIDQTPLPLSTQGNTNLRDDRKIFAETQRRSSDHDTECLDHLYRHMSVASHTSVKTHIDYPAYQLLPIGVRSYPFFMMLRDIHSIGNAATKLYRTRLYVNVAQNDLSHEAYMDLVTSMTETFKLDFESTTHPGYVSLPELTSFLYLAGLDHDLFRRPIDELLNNTPTGRFPDPTALMTKLQAWKLSNALSFARDTVSTQGSALIASKPPPLTPRTKKEGTKKDGTLRAHLHTTPCTWCLATDKVQRFGHLSAYCSKNPNRLPSPSTQLQPPATVATTSNTSHRLRALLSQLDHAATPDASNAAMLLIAEAAIKASDYPDTA